MESNQACRKKLLSLPSLKVLIRVIGQRRTPVGGSGDVFVCVCVFVLGGGAVCTCVHSRVCEIYAWSDDFLRIFNSYRSAEIYKATAQVSWIGLKKARSLKRPFLRGENFLT